MGNSKKLLRTVLLLAVAAGIIYFVVKKITAEKKDEAGGGGSKGKGNKTILADAYVVKNSVLDQTIDATGTLQSNEEIQIQPEVNGRITGLFFKEGTNVSKGTLLVKLYDADLRATLQKLELQQQLYKTTLERQENLLKINGISRQDVDVTRNQVEAAGADMEFTRTQIQKTEIRAPFNGRLGLRNVSEGAIVTPATVIATLQQIDPLKIDFAIPEKYRNTVHLSDPVGFKVTGDTLNYKGSIYAIDPKIDLSTRTVKLRAIVPNNGRLFPGSFARVTIYLKDNPNAIMVPTQAIIPGTRDKKVLVMDHGKVKFVTVETGTRTEDNVQITSGLEIGDTVVTTGILQLKEGMPVKFNKVQ